MQVPFEVVHAATKAALQALRNLKLLSFRQVKGAAGPQWLTTQIGRAVYECSMPTAAGIALFNALKQTHEDGLDLSEGAPLIYLVVQVSSLVPVDGHTLDRKRCSLHFILRFNPEEDRGCVLT